MTCICVNKIIIFNIIIIIIINFISIIIIAIIIINKDPFVLDGDYHINWWPWVNYTNME